MAHRVPHMRHTVSTLAGAALIGSTSALLGAQQPSPTFKAGIDLVRMDVRVTDADGVPIRDLRADEIVVSDAGEPAPVVFFQHIEEPLGTYDDVAQRTIRGEVSTNRGAPRGHLYVLVFDQQHIAPGNEQRARAAAQRFLNTRVRPGDRVAVFALPGPGPQIRFTGNVKGAIAELPKVRGGLERTELSGVGAMGVEEAYQIVRGDQAILARVVSRLADESTPTEVAGGRSQTRAAAGDSSSSNELTFVRAVKENAQTVVAKADGDARRFLLLLTRLMREMRDIDGRKSVVVFSEGFFSDHVTRELEDAAAAAAESYSVMYGVDLNRRGPSPADFGPRGSDQQREEQSRLEPLASLALETDGQLFIDANSRLDRVFASIADQSQDYYIVGFPPAATTTRERSKYRRVTIRVTRRGARVSARTGYALDAADLSPAARRRAIDTAFTAPFPEQGLPVEFTTYVLRGTASGAEKVVLAVAAQIPAHREPQRPGAVDVVFAVQEARTGRVISSGTDTLTLRPDAGSAEPASASGSCRVQFEASPGEYIARVVVREPGGLVGSADRRFEVRDLDGPALSASDLVIGSVHDALPVRLRTSAADVLTGTLELYGRNAEALRDVDVRVDLATIGSDAPLRTIQADLLDIDETDRGATRTALIEMPLADAPPGRYLVRAAIAAGGAAASTLTREIEIVARDLLSAATTGASRETSGRRGGNLTTLSQSFAPEHLLSGEAVRRYLDKLRHSAPALGRAVEFARSGAWDKVEAALGDDPAGAAVRGLARLARGDYAVAATLLESALDVDRQDGAAAFFLGWAQSARGAVREAISAWRRAAFIDPTFVPAHLALADAYIDLGERALAVQAVRAGLMALPRSPELIDKLSRLESRQDR
jgi:VWFA-related protein